MYDLPNHNINLMINTPIMFLTNIDQSKRLCNDIRLIVTRYAEHVIEAELISDKNIGYLI
jgi:hypothetical protein